MAGNFNPDEYVSVQERIVRFWQAYPDGAIRTILVSDPADWKMCRYKAHVYKHRDHADPDAVGYAVGIQGVGMTGKTTWEETAETSAIGRALANLGYATKDSDRPSREEMEKMSGPQDYQPAQTRQSAPVAPRPAPASAARQNAPQAPQNGAAAPTPIDSKAPRTQAQFEEIQTLIDATQSDAERICQHYRIGSLGDLTRATADHLIATLRTKAAKLAEASS